MDGVWATAGAGVEGTLVGVEVEGDAVDCATGFGFECISTTIGTLDTMLLTLETMHTMKPFSSIL